LINHGDIRATLIAAEFMRRGWEVFLPINSASRADLIASKDNKILRIQCKTGNFYYGKGLRPNRVKFSTSGKGRKGYIGEVDYIAVHVVTPTGDAIYLVPPESVPRTEATLYILAEDNDKLDAANYLIDNILDQRIL